MSNLWLRLWHDMPNDPKWRTIARVSKQPIATVLAVYVHMLVCASNATERGRTQGWSDEDIATALDIETENVSAIRTAMEGRVLEGDYLSGWESRQPKREDNSATRSKEWREKNKAIESQERNRTQPNATEPKIRGDKEREIDKESISTEQPVDKSLLVKMPHDELPLPWREWAKTEKYWDDAIVQDVWHGFKDYWKNGKGKSIKREDWLPSWRTWCRKENIRAKDAMAQKRPANDPQQFQTAYAGKTHGDVVGTINKKNEILQRFQGNA